MTELLELGLQLEVILRALRFVGLLLLGILAVKVLAFVVGRAMNRRFSEQSTMITRKLIFYAGFLIVVMTLLADLGLNLAALLGAFGIAGIAIGFAAQTSVSNVISGMFLISEKPFEIGDIVRVGENTGVVLSIDLLSIKIRTFDNQFLRIPNETLIKSDVVNITRYPIRRVTFEFVVEYSTELSLLKRVLLSLAAEIPEVLDNPEPLYLIKGFGLRGVDIVFGVWFAKDDFLLVRNTVAERMKQEFEANDIRFGVVRWPTES
ncbi:MAG: mechanosensitive ion channel family protein [Spirochaetia bacterium]